MIVYKTNYVPKWVWHVYIIMMTVITRILLLQIVLKWYVSVSSEGTQHGSSSY